MTNPSPLWGKWSRASRVSKGLAEGKAVWTNRSRERVVLRFLPLHSRRPGTLGPGSWRFPAHLGFHQLLPDAFGRVLAAVQLLQLALGPLLRLADVLQQLGGLRAGFHGLKGEGTGERWPSLSKEKDGDHLLNRKKNWVTLNGYFYPFFKTYKRFILFCVSSVLRCTYICFLTSLNLECIYN